MRWFIVAIDTREILQLSASCFRVQPFYVAAFAFVQWGIHKDFDEFSGIKQAAREFSFRAEGRNKRYDHDQSRVYQELCHLGYPPNVFHAVGLSKSQISIEPVANIVTVENVSMLAVGVQPLFQ